MFPSVHIRAALALLAVFCGGGLRAQLGGDEAYAFLRMPSSAKQAAMADAAIFPKYNDISQVSQMPALLDTSMHQQAAVYYANYFDNAHLMQAALGWNFPRYGVFALTLRSLHYGSFVRTNEWGEEEGVFSANEFALMVHYAYHFSPIFYAGITVKTALSQLERYVSAGLAMDAALRYVSLDGLASVAIAVSNAGLQIKPYNSRAQRQPMPFALQFAAAYKLEAAPLGFALKIDNLQRWNLYGSASASDPQESAFMRAGKEMMCHLSFGAGLYPSEYFFLTAGYNYGRANALASAGQSFGSGFSIGAGVLVKRIEISYAWAIYHPAGGSHNIGIVFRP